MPVLVPEMVGPMLSTGLSSRRPDQIAPRFKAGDTVRARNVHPVGHTRLPRYIRGKRGVIHSDHGVFAFPDAEAHRLEQAGQHVYSVCFEARELWGEQASARDKVYIDLFDDYIDAEPGAAASGHA